MFIGHFAVGFAAKRAAPRSSLGALLAAPLLLDLLWPVFLLAGWEQVRIEPGNTAFAPLAFVHYPISHSLIMAIVWGLAMAALYWAATRYRTGAIVIAAGVVSHWVMDAIVHRPDLPLYPGSSTFIGLGLWNSIAGTIAVEGALFLAGVWIYAAYAKPRDTAGRFGLWTLVIVLIALYLANAFGPPPPSVSAVAAAGLAGWLFPVWAAWLDRHRSALRNSKRIANQVPPLQ